MSKVFNLKSKFLDSLNKTLQDLTMKESITILKSPIMEADGNFTSVVQSVNDGLDKNKLNTDITVDDEENKKAEEIQDKKKQLKSLVIDKIKQTLDVSDELQAVLNDLDKLNKEDHSKEWVVNKEDNTATLNDKNMRIFKQNEKLCLSHNGKIEIFDSVEELHDWLIKNNVKLPEGIAIHESTDNLLTELKTQFKNRPDYDWDKIGKWKNILLEPANATDRAMLNKSMSKEEFDTYMNDLQKNDEAEKLTKKVMNKADTNRYLNSNPEDDPTREIQVIDDIIIPQEECTTTANLGAPMQYTANKKLDEEALLTELNAEQGRRDAIRTSKAIDGIKTKNDKAREFIIKLIVNAGATPNTQEFVKTLPLYTEDGKTRETVNKYFNGPKNEQATMLLDGGLPEKIHNYTTDTAQVLNAYRNKALPNDVKLDIKRSFAQEIDLDMDLSDVDKSTIIHKVENACSTKFNTTIARLITRQNYQDVEGKKVINTLRPTDLFNALVTVMNAAKNVGLKLDYSAIPDPKNYTNGKDYWFEVRNGRGKVGISMPMKIFFYCINGYDITSINTDKLNEVKEIYPSWFGISSGSAQPKMDLEKPIPSQEKYLTNDIISQLKNEEKAINQELATNRAFRFAVNGWINDLNTQDPDMVLNDLLNDESTDALVKKAVLLQAINNRIALSPETLKNYADTIGLKLAKTSAFMKQADIDSFLQQNKGSKLINQIKQFINVDQEDDDELSFGDENNKTTEEKQLKAIKLLKKGKETKKYPDGVLTAIASAMLQDPDVDTSKTQDKWEALLGEAKTFKEKMQILKEALFKEDETPDDFASGISSEMKAPSSDADTTTDTNTNDQNFDLGNEETPNNQPASFGDINIDAGGFDPDEYGPDAADDDNLGGLPMPTEEFVIEDVLVNKEDKSDIKVKLRNTQTNEIITKDLSEIDI